MSLPLGIFDRLMYNVYRSAGRYYCGTLSVILAVIAIDFHENMVIV